MSTNLLFGTNIEALESTSSDASSTESGYDTDNLWTASRDLHWMADTAGTSHYVGYRNASTAVNYFAVCRADYHILGGTNPKLYMRYSANDADFSTWGTTDILTSANLCGPNSQDYVYYNATTATAEYWRLYLTDTASVQPEAAGVYFGTALDLGRDPDGIDISVVRYGQSNKKARHDISLSYTDISYTLAMQLYNEVVERADYHPIVLFTTTNHQVLFNSKMIQVRLIDGPTKQEITGRNNIELTFREVI